MQWDVGLDLDFEDYLADVRNPEAFIARGDMTDIRYGLSGYLH